MTIEEDKEWKEWQQGWEVGGFDQTDWEENYKPDWGEGWQLGATHRTDSDTEWEKSNSKGIFFSFRSLHESFTPTTLFFVLMGIAVLFPFGARAKGADPVPPVVASFAPVHPVHPVHNVVRPAEIREIRDMINQLALIANIPVPDLNSPPVARNPALPPVLPSRSIDRLPNDEEKWKGDLTLENLKSQTDQTKLLRDQGNLLRYELYQLNPNHTLFTRETARTLGGYKIRRAIRTDRQRYFDLKIGLGLGDVAFAEQHFQVRETTLEQYREWGTCADTFSTAIEELRTQR